MFYGLKKSAASPAVRATAEALARLGIVSLHIDLPGRGDSEGDTMDITVEGDLAAAQQAIDVLAARAEVDNKRIGLLGISWGGSLAATLAGRDRRVTATVLLSTPPYEPAGWKPRFQKIEGW